MSDKKMPEIPELSPEKVKLLIAADWLQNLATMIRRGVVQGFSLDWGKNVEKPVGTVALATEAIHSPMELRLAGMTDFFQSMAAEPKTTPKPEPEPTSEPIPYQDMTEELADHDCEDPRCLFCNPPYEA